jgi:hypothetical protein
MSATGRRILRTLAVATGLAVGTAFADDAMEGAVIFPSAVESVEAAAAPEAEPPPPPKVTVQLGSMGLSPQAGVGLVVGRGPLVRLDTTLFSGGQSDGTVARGAAAQLALRHEWGERRGPFVEGGLGVLALNVVTPERSGLDYAPLVGAAAGYRFAVVAPLRIELGVAAWYFPLAAGSAGGTLERVLVLPRVTLALEATTP